MKQFIIAGLSLTLALPLSASAATFVVSPASGSYHVGDTVTLYVSVNPGGDTIYTAMMDARVSSSIFDIVSFSLNDALLPLKQSGYDALDSAQGILTKTGGYTGGITTTSSFGTIVLRAKAAGTGTFSIVDSSKLLDSNNADKQSGVNAYSFVVLPPTATMNIETSQTIQTTEPKAQVKVRPTVDERTQKPALAIQEKEQSIQDASSSQSATAAGSGRAESFFVVWIALVLVAFAAGYATGRSKFLLFVR